jgi:hypothetical protein
LFDSEWNGYVLEVEYEAKYQRWHLFNHIRIVFLPNLADRAALDEFAEEMTMLLMDE